MRRRLLVLAVPVAALVVAATTTGWASAASAAVPSHGKRLATVTAAPARVAAPSTAAVPASSVQRCTETSAGSPERKAGGVRFCVRPDVKAGASTDGTALRDASTCAVTGSGQMRYQRFGSCLKTAITGTLVNDKGAVIGTGTLSMVHSVTLKPTASSFDEQTTVTLSNVTGQVTQVSVSLTASCTSGCTAPKASPWTGAKVLSRGQSASGTISYSHTLVKGAVDTTRTRYDAVVTVPNAVPVQPNVSWDGVVDIRCDYAVGNNPGCVYPGARPDFQVSLSLYGAAAVTYYWAQIALPDGWGADTPLRRLASDSLAEANRRSTCDATFVPFSDDIVVDDSCDEFPFAKTYEGGTPGPLCADIVPLLENGQWQIYEANPAKPVTGQEKCVRGHVPLGENEGAGGELGRFTQAQRVLDLDPYTVTLVS